MRMRAAMLILMCAAVLCIVSWGLMNLRQRTGVSTEGKEPPPASPETRHEYSANDVAGLYDVLLLSPSFETVGPFLKRLSRNRPDLVAHLEREWQPFECPDWVWTYMEPGHGITYNIFCRSRIGTWRADKGLMLIGCQTSYDAEKGSFLGVVQFVASLKWPGVPEAPYFVTRPSVEGGEFRLDVCLSWDEGEHWQERGVPVIKGVFDGHKFRWLGLSDRLGEYKLDRLPEAYRITGLPELKAEVTNTPQFEE